MKNRSIRITAVQQEILEYIAEKEGRTVSDVIRQALTQYIGLYLR